MKKCKYYNKRIDTIKAYISCLYDLDDGNCCTGGLLHIVTDDGNLEDHHITYCLNECINHPEREESGIGKLICEELLKLPMEQRKLVYTNDWTIDVFCRTDKCCDKCWICRDDLDWWEEEK